jgi:hypothetical protein
MVASGVEVGVSLGCGVTVSVAVAVAFGTGVLMGLGEAVEVIVGCGVGVASGAPQPTKSNRIHVKLIAHCSIHRSLISYPPSATTRIRIWDGKNGRD